MIYYVCIYMKHNIYEILKYTASKSSMIHRYACAIVHRNKIIAVGYNKYILSFNDDNIYIPKKYSIHAEKDAIMKVKDKKLLKESKIYVIRISRSDNFIIESPCDMCEKLLDKYNIKK